MNDDYGFGHQDPDFGGSDDEGPMLAAMKEWAAKRPGLGAGEPGLGEDVFSVRMASASANPTASTTPAAPADPAERRPQRRLLPGQVDLNDEKTLEQMDLEDPELRKRVGRAREQLREQEAWKPPPELGAIQAQVRDARSKASDGITSLRDETLALTNLAENVLVQGRNAERLARNEIGNGFPDGPAMRRAAQRKLFDGMEKLVSAEVYSSFQVLFEAFMMSQRAATSSELTWMERKLTSAGHALEATVEALCEVERNSTLARRGFEGAVHGLTRIIDPTTD